MDKPDIELSRRTIKGQCTLPRRIRDYLGVGPGDHVAFVLMDHIHGKAALPEPSGFDNPTRLDASLDAVRWGGTSTSNTRNPGETNT